MVENSSTRLTIEKAELDKGASEQQFSKNIRNHQSFQNKLEALHQDLCRFNHLELTGMLPEQRYSSNVKIELALLEVYQGDSRILWTDKSQFKHNQSNH